MDLKKWRGVQGKVWKEERAGRNVYYRLKNKIKRKKEGTCVFDIYKFM